MTVAAPTRKPRETPVMDAKIRMGSAERTNRQETKA